MYACMCLSIYCQVNKITQEIAYPEFIKDDEELNEFYANVSLHQCFTLHHFTIEALIIFS